MAENFLILAINPGSTSTKISLFRNEECIATENLSHSIDEIKKYHTIYDQKDMRTNVIMNWLEKNNVKLSDLSAVVGRGGLLRPMPGGTYTVTEMMLEDLKTGYQGQHASNLGGIIADKIAKQVNIPAYIADPVSVDEYQDVARISGMPEIERMSIFHALNQKAVARRYAAEYGKNYEDVNLIVVHLGGGVSVGTHKDGRVIDVNNALDGEGPFSPERSGGVPVGSLVELCYSGKFTLAEMKKKITGRGGMVAYLNTNDFIEIEKKAMGGDKEYKLIFDAFVYQVAKEIGKNAAVLSGKVDAVILTGGIAYSKPVVAGITEMVSFISPVVVYAGEDELLALAQGGMRVLNGEENAKTY